MAPVPYIREGGLLGTTPHKPNATGAELKLSRNRKGLKLPGLDPKKTTHAWLHPVRQAHVKCFLESKATTSDPVFLNPTTYGGSSRIVSGQGQNSDFTHLVGLVWKKIPTRPQPRSGARDFSPSPC